MHLQKKKVTFSKTFHERVLVTCQLALCNVIGCEINKEINLRYFLAILPPTHVHIKTKKFVSNFSHLADVIRTTDFCRFASQQRCILQILFNSKTLLIYLVFSQEASIAKHSDCTRILNPITTNVKYAIHVLLIFKARKGPVSSLRRRIICSQVQVICHFVTLQYCYLIACIACANNVYLHTIFYIFTTFEVYNIVQLVFCRSSSHAKFVINHKHCL